MHKQPLSLKRRVFIRLLVITIAAVLLFYGISMYLNFAGIATVRNDLQSANDAETRYIAGRIQRDVDDLTTFTYELANDKKLLRYSFASETLSAYQRIEYITGFSDQLLRIKRLSNLVESAEIYLPEVERVVVTDRTIYNTMDRKTWETLCTALDGKTQILTELNGRFYLLFAGIYGKQPNFIVSICISPERLLQQMQSLCSDSEASVALVRPSGELYVGSKKAAALWEEQSASESTRTERSFFASTANIPALGFRLWLFTPSDAVLQPVLRHSFWILALTLLAAVLLSLYLLYYRYFILRPINTIFESVRKAAETGHFHIDSTDADFDDVYAQFNNMVGRIESLTSEVYEERFRAQQSELRQLQMQINPHFFYNTLFMLYRMAQAEGNDTIAGISLNLSNYYHYITKLPQHDAPLRDEVKHISNYLEIQGVRFAPRVRVQLDELPEAIANERIPPLILQPIVENAFVHGVKNKESDGIVHVRFFTDETHFGVVVYDNGGEMDVDSVRRLNEDMRTGKLPEGSALYNLYRRMELSYGSHCELRLESVEQGLQVTVLFERSGR